MRTRRRGRRDFCRLRRALIPESRLAPESGTSRIEAQKKPRDGDPWAFRFRLLSLQFLERFADVAQRIGETFLLFLHFAQFRPKMFDCLGMRRATFVGGTTMNALQVLDELFQPGSEIPAGGTLFTMWMMVRVTVWMVRAGCGATACRHAKRGRAEASLPTEHSPTKPHSSPRGHRSAMRHPEPQTRMLMRHPAVAPSPMKAKSSLMSGRLPHGAAMGATAVPCVMAEPTAG